MKPGGGKQKGGSFERLLCKSLSLWITRGQRDDVLWRSAMSGGRATVHAKRGKKMAHVAGDICSVHPMGDAFIRVFYVEAKTYRDLKIAQMVYAGGGILVDFWKETVRLAKANGKFPMLIAKQNLYSPMVGLNGDGVDELDLPLREDAVATFWKLDLHIYTLETVLGSNPSFLPLELPRRKLKRR